MSALDRDVLAETTQSVVRHLARVAGRLPVDAAGLRPASDASDAVILHLWQATQVVNDLAVAAFVHEKLGTPSSYADAFRRFQDAGIVDEALAARLIRAAGFCNTVAHAYEAQDMARVYRTAKDGPSELLAFLGALRDHLASRPARQGDYPDHLPDRCRAAPCRR